MPELKRAWPRFRAKVETAHLRLPPFSIQNGKLSASNIEGQYSINKQHPEISQPLLDFPNKALNDYRLIPIRTIYINSGYQIGYRLMFSLLKSREELRGERLLTVTYEEIDRQIERMGRALKKFRIENKEEWENLQKKYFMKAHKPIYSLFHSLTSLPDVYTNIEPMGLFTGMADMYGLIANTYVSQELEKKAAIKPPQYFSTERAQLILQDFFSQKKEDTDTEKNKRNPNAVIKEAQRTMEEWGDTILLPNRLTEKAKFFLPSSLNFLTEMFSHYDYVVGFSTVYLELIKFWEGKGITKRETEDYDIKKELENMEDRCTKRKFPINSLGWYFSTSFFQLKEGNPSLFYSFSKQFVGRRAAFFGADNAYNIFFSSITNPL